MDGRPLDTSAAQQEVYFAHLRHAGEAGRARILVGLCTGVRSLAEAGIRSAHPEFSDAEVRAELTFRLYGEAVAARLHGARWRPGP